MPSLMRFLSVLALLGGLGFAGVYALATFVTPRTREMTVTVPAGRLKAPPAEAAARAPVATAAQAAVPGGTTTR